MKVALHFLRPPWSLRLIYPRSCYMATLLCANKPKSKRFRTEEMIDIQTQLLKEVAALRKVQEELLQVEREAGNRETNTRNKET